MERSDKEVGTGVRADFNRELQCALWGVRFSLLRMTVSALGSVSCPSVRVPLGSLVVVGVLCRLRNGVMMGGYGRGRGKYTDGEIGGVWVGGCGSTWCGKEGMLGG